MPYTLLCLCEDHVDSSSISLENAKIEKKEKDKRERKERKHRTKLKKGRRR